MKSIVCVCLLGLVAAALARPDDKSYTTKYDGIDIQEILQNDRALQGHFKCMMDNGPCTPEGKELKATLPDALETGCSKCNPNQKKGAEDVIKFLIHNKRDMWDALVAKYDTEGKYSKKYEEEYKRVAA